jgi:hypothetical protein
MWMHYNLPLMLPPAEVIKRGSALATIVIQGIIVPDQPVAEGLLVKSTSLVWQEIAKTLGADWSQALLNG